MAATAKEVKKTSFPAKDTSGVKSRRVERPEPIIRSQSAGTASKSSPPKSKGKEKAADFSSLFSFEDDKPPAMSGSTAKTTGMARRMLARAQTVPSSSGSDSPDPHVRDSTRRQPLPTMKADTIIDPTEEAPLKTAPIKAAKSASFDNSPPRTNSRATNLRTYGGTSHTFLIAIPVDQLPSLNDSQLTEDSVASLLQSQENEFDTHESYASLRSRWGVDNSEDDPHQPLAEGSTAWLRKKKGKPGRPPPVPLSGPSVSELRSITELRNTGESRRFNDEVGYLFEGLAVESELSVKRGRYVYRSSDQRDSNERAKCRGAGRQDGRSTLLSQRPICGLRNACLGGITNR